MNENALSNFARASTQYYFKNWSINGNNIDDILGTGYNNQNGCWGDSVNCGGTYPTSWYMWLNTVNWNAGDFKYQFCFTVSSSIDDMAKSRFWVRSAYQSSRGKWFEVFGMNSSVVYLNNVSELSNVSLNDHQIAVITL